MRALGFCVSVEHARFMARVFTRSRRRLDCGVGRQPDEERRRRSAQISPLGVSTCSFPSTSSMRASTYRPLIPCCCFGRPIARRLFLQQLGRGLRTTSREDGLHRARLRRAASQGVPIRSAVSSAARVEAAWISRSRSPKAFRFYRRAVISSWTTFERAHS